MGDNVTRNIFTRSKALNWICLLILILTVSLVVYYRVQMQITIGPFWDTYSYLVNALEFAGMGTGYFELERAPLIPFLTSLLFRMGLVSELAIYIVDGLIFIFGALGLYQLFKLRFNPVESLAGTTLYISFPLILGWLGLGYVDLASVSFSIWALYATVLAVDHNPKYFYLAFPLAMAAFLTRFTAGFVVFPILLYILMGGSYLKDFRYMLKGFLASLVLLIPYIVFMFQKTGDPFFSIAWSLSFRGESLQEHFAYTDNPFYYFQHLDSFIATQGPLHHWIYYLLLTIIIIGLVIYLYNIFRSRERITENIFQSKASLLRMKTILLVILILGFIFTLNKISYLASIAIFFLLCFLSYNLLKGREGFKLDILFLSWFVTQFLSIVSFALKVDRYFIPMAPALAYFTVLALHQVSGKLKINYRKHNLTTYLLPFLLILVAISSTSIYLDDTQHSRENYMYSDFAPNQKLTVNINSAVEKLEKYDPSYHDKNIRAEVWPAYIFKLQTNMSEHPSFNNTTALNHELEKNNIDYYISLNPTKLGSYFEIARAGDITIYQQDPAKKEDKPRMLYIGQNWQHYIDQVLGLRAFVEYEGQGRFSIGKATEVDSHSLEELQQYPYLLLYNFKWHNQPKTEELLLNYVKSGGTLIIDASGNLEGSYYNLDNTAFLNTVITKKSISTNPVMEPGNLTGLFSPFVSDGQTWYGADYESSVDPRIEPLVTADGRTLIGVQRVGKGKIIWIGYNLVWHAFNSGNQNEMGVIQDSIGLNS